MPAVDDTLEQWRAALVTGVGGLPVVVVGNGRIIEANAPARALAAHLRIGMAIEDLLCTTKEDRLLIVLPADTPQTQKVAAHLIAANAELANATREVVKAKEAEQQLRAQLETVERASRLVNESLADAPRGDISAVLSVIALEAQSLTRADYVALGIGTDPERPFRFWVSLGVSPDAARSIGRLPRPVGLLGRVARDGDCIRMADLRRHPQFQGMPAHHPPMESFIGMPIYRRGKPVGNLYLAKAPDKPEFSDHDESLVRMLAARVGAAIETTALFATEASERVWLQSVIDQMPGAILLYDADGKLKAVNQGLSALECEARGGVDAFGNPLLIEWTMPDDTALPDDRAPVARVLQSQEVLVREEMRVRCRNGALVPVLVDACPIRADTETVAGAIVVLQDISDRKKLERLRDEWTAVVAHDLRQPVNTIMLAAELALRAPKDEPNLVRMALERISSSAKRLSRMICDLLDASRIEANRLSLARRSVDLVPYLRSILDDLRDVTRDHRVNLIAPHEEGVNVDPERIHQVMTNLISNAVKYGAPDTDVDIEVVPQGEWVEVVVSNRGAGIAPEELPKLFNRFSRGKAGAARQVPGLGLGLYITKGLVEAHGGRLWVESTVGETTRFHFTIPRATPVSTAEQDPTRADPE